MSTLYGFYCFQRKQIRALDNQLPTKYVMAGSTKLIHFIFQVYFLLAYIYEQYVLKAWFQNKLAETS